mmetsp:Transcript_126908/g.317152  ORF Transcript_126908/g.317152 Transcript_126908/m.317152 type:complete len:204 (+) Transcript_126908:416-1027(+)
MSCNPKSSAICEISLAMPFLLIFSIISFIFVCNSSSNNFNLLLSAACSSILSPVRLVCVPCVRVLLRLASSSLILFASSSSTSKRHCKFSKSPCNSCTCPRNSLLAARSASSSSRRHIISLFCSSETRCRAACSACSEACWCWSSSNSFRACAAAASAAAARASAFTKVSLASTSSFRRPSTQASAFSSFRFKVSVSRLRISC